MVLPTTSVWTAWLQSWVRIRSNFVSNLVRVKTHFLTYMPVKAQLSYLGQPILNQPDFQAANRRPRSARRTPSSGWTLAATAKRFLRPTRARPSSTSSPPTLRPSSSTPTGSSSSRTTTWLPSLRVSCYSASFLNMGLSHPLFGFIFPCFFAHC